MEVLFPSKEFFVALQQQMDADREKFRRLGFIDVTMGVKIVSNGQEGSPRLFKLVFSTYDCKVVEEVRPATPLDSFDFVLAASATTWQELIENIRQHGEADRDHSLNTLSHLSDPMQVLYEDPDGHDTFFRTIASLQDFFNLAAKVNVAFV